MNTYNKVIELTADTIDGVLLKDGGAIFTDPDISSSIGGTINRIGWIGYGGTDNNHFSIRIITLKFNGDQFVADTLSRVYVTIFFKQ